jgi:hypothetical protein
MSPIFLGAVADSKEGLLESDGVKRASDAGEKKKRL